MTPRAYLSNIAPAWTFSRQEDALRVAIPSYPSGANVYRDSLDPTERRGHAVASLLQRASLLRSTTRKVDSPIYVASLAVLAWTIEDMLDCITRIAARGAELHVLDAGLQIGVGADVHALRQAVEAFTVGRKARAAGEAGLLGGEVSGKRRREQAKQAAETIRNVWCLPTSDYPTAELLKTAGISLNTAKLHLGPRPDAQRAHQAAIKRRKGKENA